MTEAQDSAEKCQLLLATLPQHFSNSKTSPVSNMTDIQLGLASQTSRIPQPKKPLVRQLTLVDNYEMLRSKRGESSFQRSD